MRRKIGRARSTRSLTDSAVDESVSEFESIRRLASNAILMNTFNKTDLRNRYPRICRVASYAVGIAFAIVVVGCRPPPSETEDATSDNKTVANLVPPPPNEEATAAPTQPVQPSPTKLTPGRLGPRKGRGSGSIALKGVEEDMLAKWDAIHSLSATMKTFLHRKTSPTITQDGFGTREFLKSGEKLLVRTKLTNSFQVEVDKEEYDSVVSYVRILKVFDGQFLFVQKQTHDGMTVTKERAAPERVMAIGGPGLLIALRRLLKLVRETDKLIDGRMTYRFSGYHEDRKTKIRYAIDKETGLLRKYEKEAASGDFIQRIELLDYKINPPPFPEGHFTYTPPEDVEIQDLTRSDGALPADTPGS